MAQMNAKHTKAQNAKHMMRLTKQLHHDAKCAKQNASQSQQSPASPPSFQLNIAITPPSSKSPSVFDMESKLLALTASYNNALKQAKAENVQLREYIASTKQAASRSIREQQRFYARTIRQQEQTHLTEVRQLQMTIDALTNPSELNIANVTASDITETMLDTLLNEICYEE